jgi:hypothetical protein
VKLQKHLKIAQGEQNLLNTGGLFPTKSHTSRRSNFNKIFKYMVIIIVLVIAGALYYFYKSSPMSDPADVKARYKNRSEDQKKVIRYFTVHGCFSKTMSDAQYSEHVKSTVSKIDFKQKALDKIGLDESELKEIDPVTFEGYVFDNKKAFSKRGKDDLWRSSCYQVTWLFFSSTQVYMYQNTLNLDEDGKKETTEEYFYKDITNFSTSTDTVETSYWNSKQKKNLLENIDSNRFALTVPGEKFYCSMEQNEYTERAIQAMKAKLREKKNA